MSRVVVIVLDSFGVGELPDADKFGDAGVHTLKHIIENVDELKIPNMRKLGLFHIDGLDLEKNDFPIGAFGKMTEKSPAKDTITGHFEMMGLITEKPYQIFMNGFPQRIIDELEKRIGTKVIGNYLASGTVIIQDLGEEHVKTGYPIVYTSADSLMQIAMHEDIIPLERQYEICQIARELMMGDDIVARIICRPFVGSKESGFTRTEGRKDFSIDPPGNTLLNTLKDAGKDVIAVGKIEDIFNNSGITRADHTRNNKAGIEATKQLLKDDFDGLLFVNLVDFDMLYGHRRDVQGYAEALEYFDQNIPAILGELNEEDILMITADHGCDPTAQGSDHTREYIPIMVYGKQIEAGINIGIRDTFADIAATIADRMNVNFDVGTSFLDKISVH